jgi:hypothetical protein
MTEPGCDTVRCRAIPIAWHCESDYLELPKDDAVYAISISRLWLRADPSRCTRTRSTLRPLDYESNMQVMSPHWSYMTNHAIILCKLHRTESYHWIAPDIDSHSGHRMDWYTSVLGNTIVFTTPETTITFYPTLNIAAKTCSDLMVDRKQVKSKIKALAEMGDRSNIAYAKSLEHLQYSLKIINNSLYGCMTFRAYNTYSPRCGMSVTGCGRWSLNVSSVIAQSLGMSVVYGDTDSIMYCLNHNRSFNEVLCGIIAGMAKQMANVEGSPH